MRIVAGHSSVSELDSHVGYWLRTVSNHVSHAFQRKVEDSGVTVAEWVVLRLLHGSEPVNPSQLAERMGMTRGAVSKLVERLVRKQLVERLASRDDRRFQTVGLTADGRKLVPVLARLADRNDHEFFGQLSAADRRKLVAQLRQIARFHGWQNSPVD
ncbi:HTH-type transcriptional repressor NicR [Caulifigura coniformis]|uniref:HTH-type transcriptional repressor NicR n=1 Tax=Caulifigura coniformis TaxID=2527983 RepID=A0A517S7B5_9PLAN|nr:MarR family transcriptional regulator [Caulifigura coniformis]QDT52009.1 HTH-type transcriptional repressor NicR [Caulifigura coniformis]